MKFGVVRKKKAKPAKVKPSDVTIDGKPVFPDTVLIDKMLERVKGSR